MRKFFGILLVLMLALSVFAACSDKPTEYYTVIFELDGGAIAGKDVSEGISVLDGTELNLKNYIPTKEHNEFSGWKSAEGADYAADAVIKVDKDITIKAQWTVNSYTVTFDIGNATMEEASTIEVNAYEEIDLSSYVPVNNDSEFYSFDGWQSGETVYGTTDKVTVSADIAFKAVYKSSLKFSEPKNGEVSLEGFADDADISKYKTVEFPAVDASGNKITEIKSSAFFDVGEVIENVSLEKMIYLREIGGSAFQNPNVKTVSLKGLSNLKRIGAGAFEAKYISSESVGALETIDFSGCSSLEFLGQMIFMGQKFLKNIDLSSCVALKNIERQAFNGCESLETVKLPANIGHMGGAETIGELDGSIGDMFNDCVRLKAIEVTPGGESIYSKNGVLYKDGAIVKYPAAKEGDKFIAPADVTAVGSGAFLGADNLAEIDLTGCTLKEIKKRSFDNRNGLTVKVAFNAQFINRTDYSKVVVDETEWNKIDKTAIEYADFEYFELTTDLEDGKYSTEENYSFTASGKFGSDDCELEVKVNGVAVTAEGKKYNAPLKIGENTITIVMKKGELTYEKKYVITRIEGIDLSVDGLANGKKFVTEQYVEFDITAKLPDGKYLKAADIEVWFDWGYGYYNKAKPGELTDNGNKIHLKWDITYFTDMGFFFEGDPINIKIIANYNGAKEEAIFTNITWEQA